MIDELCKALHDAAKARRRMAEIDVSIAEDLKGIAALKNSIKQKRKNAWRYKQVEKKANETIKGLRCVKSL